MKIYTSYYGKYGTLLRNDILPIGISLSKPKWITEYMPFINQLAPSWAFKNMEYDHYLVQYRCRLSKLDMRDVLTIIESHSKTAGGKDVALLCYEPLKYLQLGQQLDKNTDWCHRTMLADYVNEQVGSELITEYSDKPKQHFVQLSLL